MGMNMYLYLLWGRGQTRCSTQGAAEPSALHSAGEQQSFDCFLPHLLRPAPRFNANICALQVPPGINTYILSHNNNQTAHKVVMT